MSHAAVAQAHELDAQEDLLLARLASELGIEASLLGPLASGSLEQLAETLRPERHALRLVELQTHSLPNLTLPAWLHLDGALAVLRQVGPRSVQVERADGQRQTLSHPELLRRCEGRALEVFPRLVRSGSFVSRVLDFLSLRGSDLTKLGLLTLALTALGLAVPYATQLVIDRALPERTPKLLMLVAIGVILVALQRALFSWLEQRATLALHARLEAAVTTSLFDHLLRIPYAALSREPVGAWLETLSGARRVQTLITETLLLPLLQLLMVFVYGLALLRHDVGLSVGLVLGALLMLLLALGFALRAATLERSLIEASSQQQSALHEVLRGLPTLRISGAEQRGTLRWLSRLLTARSSAVRKDLLLALGSALLSGLRSLLGAAVFVWASYRCLSGEQTVGALLSLVMLSDRLLGVVTGFAQILTPLLTARTHLARVDALLAHEDVTEEPARPRLAGIPEGDAVVLDDVWFRYGEDQPWILQGYSLRVPSLAHFALHGPSGMGKSTILRLIAGLYTPERGNVRVYGLRPRQLRADICYLPQESHLFQGSIAENLRLLSGASAESLRAAALASGLSELVASLPMAYETLLPPGGSTLSGGQRQLIVFTAAMASGRKLLLLDEALSQLDGLSRARLLALARAQQTTLISVEHEPRGVGPEL